MAVDRKTCEGCIAGYLFQKSNYTMDSCSLMAAEIMVLIQQLNANPPQPTGNPAAGTGGTIAAPSSGPPPAATGGPA